MNALAISPWEISGVVVFGQPQGQGGGTTQSWGGRVTTCSLAGLTGLLAAQQPIQQPKFPFIITIAVSLLTENPPQPLFSNTVNVLKWSF